MDATPGVRLESIYRIEMESEKRIIYVTNPWVGYVAAAVLIIAAVVVTLLFKNMDWFIIGVIWVSVIPASILFTGEGMRYIFTTDSLTVWNSKVAVIIGGVNLTIPRNRLIGLGSIAPVQTKATGLFFTDEDGDSQFLHIPFQKKKLKEFRDVFHNIYPEAHITDEKRSEIARELFGDKIKDVSIKGKPWRALALGRLIEITSMTLMMVALTVAFRKDRSLYEFLKPGIQKNPWYCIGLILWGLFLLYFLIREIVMRARARDKVFSIYGGGMLVVNMNLDYRFPNSFIRWKDIQSFERARVYPWIVIKYIDLMGRKKVLQIPGHLDDEDFSEIQAYIDMYQK